MAQSLGTFDLDSLAGFSVDRSTLLDTIAHRHRRRALAHLAEGGQQIPVRELAHDVAARDRADPERIAIRLYHAHLPRLDEAGLVEFDPAAPAVAPTDRGRRLAAALPGAGE